MFHLTAPALRVLGELGLRGSAVDILAPCGMCVSVLWPRWPARQWRALEQLSMPLCRGTCGNAGEDSCARTGLPMALGNT